MDDNEINRIWDNIKNIYIKKKKLPTKNDI